MTGISAAWGMVAAIAVALALADGKALARRLSSLKAFADELAAGPA